MNYKNSNILVILLVLTLSHQMATTKAGVIAPSASASRNVFATNIFQTIATPNYGSNVIYSPMSIQSCLTLAFFGADGDTASEMRKGLVLGESPKDTIASDYGTFLTNVFKNAEGGPVLKMANRIYVNEKLEISKDFQNLASEKFKSTAESIRFADSSTAVTKINTWVEEQTQNKIQNLLTPDSVNGDTSAVLVNAIYFKGLWKYPFSESSTHKDEFSITREQKTPVDMMYMDENLNYIELPKLKATAIELPYKNSELSMLILLPNEVDGLKSLEENLAKIDLNEITAQMKTESVDLLLPKFKIEYDIDLKQPLQKLGMSNMFSDKANFGNLFTSGTAPQKISDVRHKAFIDVNEAGSEAAAATYIKIVPMSLNLNQKHFHANHPFVFVIRSPQAVFFAGHVAKF